MRKIYILIIIILLLQYSFAIEKKGSYVKNTFQEMRVNSIIERRSIDINRINAYFDNNGEFYSNGSVIGPGFEWPKGSGKYAIFSAALWIGCKIRVENTRDIRVATAGHFGSEYRPGSILSNGKPEDFSQPSVKIYQVKPLLDVPTVNPDLLNWPVDKGAPWIDLNKDGEWNPNIDKVGVLFRGDTIFPDILQFCVYNDADSQYHNWIWGSSKPLGIEVRQIVWAYQRMFPDVHFLQFQIYNKSSNILDSVFFTLWSDPDIGYPLDDYVGCDTNKAIIGYHNLGFVYNGLPYDSVYEYRPPAAGFKLLQGPVILGSINDTAISFGKKWIGYKNLNLSSFTVFCNPSVGGCINPSWYDPYLYQQTFNTMQGLTRTGAPWIDKYTLDTIKFVFAGDPVTGQGFINSDLMDPGEYRMTMSCGPITMAPGDSQEVIFCTLISQGSDHLNSIINLRRLSNSLNMFLYQPNRIPNVSIKYQEMYSPPFLVKVKIADATSITAIVSSNIGTILSIQQLYNDGMHDDEESGDDVWANWFHLNSDSLSAKVSLFITYNNSQQHFDDVLTNITLSGKITLDSMIVISDNINKDFIPNPGENIRFKVLVTNRTNFTLRKVNLSLVTCLDSLISVTMPFTYSEDHINPNSSKIIPEDGYFSINIYPSAATDGEFKLLFYIFDQNENFWEETLKFNVSPFVYQPLEKEVNHISGNSEGAFKVLLTNYSELKNNDYEITFKKENELKFNLVNITNSDTLLKLWNLPDPEGHTVPVTDGFRLVRGDITDQKGIRNIVYLPESNKWFVASNQYKIENKSFGITYPTSSNFINKSSNISIENLKTVEIRFSNVITQKAYRYLSGFAPYPISKRYIKHPEFRPFVIDSNGTGFIYQDYQKYPLGNPDLGFTVPFTVWEVDRKKGIEKQLNIAIIENNDSLYRIVDGNYQYIGRGNIDGKWWPTIAENGGGEVLVIFSSEYSENPDTFYTKRNLALKFEEFDVYYIFSPKLLTNTSKFVEGDTLRIIPYRPLTEKDKFVFNPYKLLSVGPENAFADEYILYNNYPNPFNNITNIKFRISNAGLVRLEVFNVLGQKVKTLVDEKLNSGIYIKTWDGKNDNGIILSSGVYYIRMIYNLNSSVKKIIFIK